MRLLSGYLNFLFQHYHKAFCRSFLTFNNFAFALLNPIALKHIPRISLFKPKQTSLLLENCSNRKNLPCMVEGK